MSKTQEFAIVRNANVPAVTDRDLVDQFTLAKQINDKVTVAHEAVLRIRSLKDQVAARTTASTDTRLKTAAQSLTDKLTSVEGEIYRYATAATRTRSTIPSA